MFRKINIKIDSSKSEMMLDLLDVNFAEVGTLRPIWEFYSRYFVFGEQGS